MKKKITTQNDIRMRDTQHSDGCWWWLASLFMAAMLAVMAVAAVSCTEAPMAEEVRPEQEEGLPATIRLEVLPDRAEQVQTRVAEKDESAIKDLHVLVYNSAGDLIGQSYAVYNVSKPAFTVKTRSGSNNTIYAIANTSNAKLFDGTVAATETKLKAMKTPALTKWDELTTVSHLLMVGKKTNVTITAGSSTLQGGMTVERVAAKVTLNIGVKTNSGITITGCRVFSLPKQSYYVPATTDAATTWVSDSTSTAVNNAVSVEKTFFMYENRRGENKNIKVQKDKGGSNALPNASYVTIKGKANGYEATWTVCLGANNTNDFNMKRNSQYTYTITLSRPGTDGVDTRVDVCPIEEGSNSNCYMISPFSGVTVPVERANESFLQIGTSPMSNGKCIQLTAKTAWTAFLVWESSKGLVTLSDTMGTGPSGRFTVIATDKTTQGNALVAIRDDKGQIFWSWHIWVSMYDGKGTFTNNNFVFMDRALGATSIKPSDLNSCGLYYQWGRKDPFLGLGQEGGQWVIANGDPIRAYDATGAAFTTKKETVPNATPNNLAHAIRNPDTFYYNKAYPYDWFSSAQNSNLWSGNTFDPCPAGWRVPPCLNDVPPFIGMDSGWSSVTNGMSWNRPGGYFSASGSRNYDTGNISTNGESGLYWYASVYLTNGYDCSFQKNIFHPANSSYRAYGIPIRCCKQ